MKCKPNILWITIDAARKDRFSCYGYEKKTTPFIDQLSEKSIVFENAYTVAPWTLPSVASMFTGLYPSEHGAVNEQTKLKKKTSTIAEDLKKKGYETLMITQNDGWINPLFRLTKGFDTVFDIDEMIQSFLGVSVRSVGKYVFGYDVLTRLVFEKQLKKRKEPWFSYIHLMDTHLPYEPKTDLFSSFFRYLVFYKDWKRKIWNSWIGKKSFSEKEKRMLNELYDKALSEVDTQIKKLCSLVANLENTIVIITSDHGENLGEYGLFDHQFSEHDTLIKIPLIIYAPFIDVKKISSLFENKDLFFLIQKLVDGTFSSFSRDYVFGENSEPLSLYSKLLKEKKDLAKESKYIVTSKVKYIHYGNGSEVVCRDDGKIGEMEIKKQLRMLCDLKQKQLKNKNNVRVSLQG